MSKPAAGDVPIRRIDRILAFMSLGIAALSIACFFVLLIAQGVGVKGDEFATGIWPTIAAIPFYGLPIAFILMIVLLVMSFVRRARANRGE